MINCRNRAIDRDYFGNAVCYAYIPLNFFRKSWADVGIQLRDKLRVQFNDEKLISDSMVHLDMAMARDEFYRRKDFPDLDKAQKRNTTICIFKKHFFIFAVCFRIFCYFLVFFNILF